MFYDRFKLFLESVVDSSGFRNMLVHYSYSYVRCRPLALACSILSSCVRVDCSLDHLSIILSVSYKS